jgi:DNA-directed RNA polymerase specialized sigma24 family protein
MQNAVRPAIARLIERAFLTAHLLTGSIQQAEDATLKGLDSWNPDEEPGEALFQNVLDAAARTQIQPNRPDSEASGSYLPNELKAVLRLSPQLRRCFVLRVLVGLPSQMCARLLGLHSDEVDEFTCAALQCLGTS